MELLKRNDLMKWVIVAFAVGGLIYNTIVTYAILKNDVKHLSADMIEVKQEVKQINKYLIEGSKNK